MPVIAGEPRQRGAAEDRVLAIEGAVAISRDQGRPALLGRPGRGVGERAHPDGLGEDAVEHHLRRVVGLEGALRAEATEAPRRHPPLLRRLDVAPKTMRPATAVTPGVRRICSRSAGVSSRSSVSGSPSIERR